MLTGKCLNLLYSYPHLQKMDNKKQIARSYPRDTDVILTESSVDPGPCVSHLPWLHPSGELHIEMV